MSRHSMPASFRASRTASAPISIADLPGNRPNGCRPTPMIATSGTGASGRVSRGQVVRDEGGDHYLVAGLVSAEGQDGEGDLLADPRLAGAEPGQPGLHAQLADQLDEPDVVRGERPG